MEYGKDGFECAMLCETGLSRPHSWQMMMVVMMMMLCESIMNFWCHANSKFLEDCCVLESDTAHCGILLPVFQRNLLPISSGWKIKIVSAFIS
jgi:hypothetical protein